ncbi:hypothetical protein Sjap_022783 [Stephania japonica]|uniref:Uncharacterized protein n=1 Tax=Stephania japonica TaxID=461633 RepID=A0AAP0EQ19_9MAGN
MGGEWVVKKPSRSDEVLEAEQQLKVADEIRAHFESLAPKRPPKPNRSEATATHDDSSTGQDMVLPDPDHSIPELAKLRQLSSQSQSICPEEGLSGTQVEDEFVETQYYTKLNSIDKQHHTTGTGFIRVSEESKESSDFQLQQRREGAEAKSGLGSNPATNDWI